MFVEEQNMPLEADLYQRTLCLIKTIEHWYKMLFVTWNMSMAMLMGECILSTLACEFPLAAWNTVEQAFLFCLCVMLSVFFPQTS